MGEWGECSRKVVEEFGVDHTQIQETATSDLSPFAKAYLS